MFRGLLITPHSSSWRWSLTCILRISTWWWKVDIPNSSFHFSRQQMTILKRRGFHWCHWIDFFFSLDVVQNALSGRSIFLSSERMNEISHIMWGIVVGDVFQRFVARVIAHQSTPAITAATILHQFDLSIRSGWSAWPHAVWADIRFTIWRVMGRWYGELLKWLHGARCFLKSDEYRGRRGSAPFLSSNFYCQPFTNLRDDEKDVVHDVWKGEGGEQEDRLMSVLLVGRDRHILVGGSSVWISAIREALCVCGWRLHRVSARHIFSDLRHTGTRALLSYGGSISILARRRSGTERIPVRLDAKDSWRGSVPILLWGKAIMRCPTGCDDL